MRVQYLQTITAYVDTRDRALGGSALRDRLSILEGRTMAIKRELDRRAARDEEPGDVALHGSDHVALRSTGTLFARGELVTLGTEVGVRVLERIVPSAALM